MHCKHFISNVKNFSIVRSNLFKKDQRLVPNSKCNIKSFKTIRVSLNSYWDKQDLLYFHSLEQYSHPICVCPKSLSASHIKIASLNIATHMPSELLTPRSRWLLINRNYSTLIILQKNFLSVLNIILAFLSSILSCPDSLFFYRLREVRLACWFQLPILCPHVWLDIPYLGVALYFHIIHQPLILYLLFQW